VSAWSDADRQYLEEIMADCTTLLGPGMRVLAATRDDGPDGVRLAICYEMAGEEWKTEATAETVVAAHAALRRALVVDRARLGLTVLVGRS
jgi:hypothetical protein